jgi:hypothetical protein
VLARCCCIVDNATIGEIGPLTAAVATTAANTLATLLAVLISLSDGQFGTSAISEDSKFGCWDLVSFMTESCFVMEGLGNDNFDMSSGAITLAVDIMDGECSTLRGGVNNQGASSSKLELESISTSFLVWWVVAGSSVRLHVDDAGGDEAATGDSVTVILVVDMSLRLSYYGRTQIGRSWFGKEKGKAPALSADFRTKIIRKVREEEIL